MIVELFCIFVLTPLCVIVAYLDLLTLAALLPSRRVAPARSRRRFAILIPAHNEALLLPRLLQSITEMTYPTELYDIHVVADNCTDATATIARSLGAIVQERVDTLRKGKGYALNWLMGHLEEAGMDYDAYVIVDGDSVVSGNILDTLNARLEAGDEIVQVSHLVLNKDSSWHTGLTFAALALVNHLRPRGRDWLGISAGLFGNGMCFSRSVMNDNRWQAFSLTEDTLFHIQLVREGYRVRFCPDAAVYAEQPVTRRQAETQSVRWERGRLQLLRSYGPLLIREGIRYRDRGRLSMIVDQIIPQLSVLTALILSCVVVSLVLNATVPFVISLALLASEAAYVLAGLRLAGATRHEYLALIRAPLYALWKLRTIGLAAADMDDSTWIRTARSADEVK